MNTFQYLAVLGWLSWTYRVYTEVVERPGAPLASVSVQLYPISLAPLAATLATIIPYAIVASMATILR